jgi:hypothetical protein
VFSIRNTNTLIRRTDVSSCELSAAQCTALKYAELRTLCWSHNECSEQHQFPNRLQVRLHSKDISTFPSFHLFFLASHKCTRKGTQTHQSTVHKIEQQHEYQISVKRYHLACALADLCAILNSQVHNTKKGVVLSTDSTNHCCAGSLL